jgi:effector-binding domain-containing protein
MVHQCEIKKMAARPTLVVRIRTSIQDLPAKIGECFGKVMGYLGEIGEQPADAPFVAYFNMDMSDLDVEIGFPVAKALPGKGEVKASQIPGGMAGTCMYTGPYTEFAVPYEALTKLVSEKGLTPTGVSYEFYYNSPMDTEPSKLQTLIMFPLKG